MTNRLKSAPFQKVFMVALTAYMSVAGVTTARADGGGQAAFGVITSESNIKYHLVHKMHQVDAISKRVEGKAILLADGKLQVAIRVPVESFDSGNVNRDAHMKEATEAASYPIIELKGVTDGVQTPTAFPSTVDKTLKAQLVFHGVRQVFDVPVTIVWKSATEVRATAKLKISLDGYKIERPSLLFVKVDDELGLDADLLFRR